MTEEFFTLYKKLWGYVNRITYTGLQNDSVFHAYKRMPFLFRPEIAQKRRPLNFLVRSYRVLHFLSFSI